MRNKKKGFTLIELLVVVAIIGLLTTLAIVALDSARRSSRDAKRVADIKQVQTALELYFNDQDSYPESAGVLDLGLTGSLATSCGVAGVGECKCLDSSNEGFVNVCAATITYMGQVPTDPVPNDSVEYTYEARGSGANCVDNSTTPCPEYWINFTLEGDVENLPAGSICAKPEGLSVGVCS